MTARLKETYNEKVFGALNEKFQYKNPMEVPKLVKTTVNMGLGEAIANPKLLEASILQLAAITGQKPVVTRAKRLLDLYEAGSKADEVEEI